MHRQKNTKSVVRIAFLHLAAVQIFRLTRLSLKSFVFVGPSPSVSCAAACGDACGGTYLFVILLVLIIEIRLERQLCAAVYAFEATGMEECEILERPHTIHLIDGLAAAQASRLVEIWPIHNVWRLCIPPGSFLFLWQLPTGFRWTCTC